MQNIYELKDKHLGDDIWIIAAGPTMDYVDQSFFDNKISIGVNQVYRKYHPDYLLRKEADGFVDAISIGTPLIMSRYNCGSYRCGLNPKAADYVFDHEDNEHTEVNLEVISLDSKKIVVSYSTITSAIHVAAVMGAANIILCGHDCGMLDGKSRFDGYPEAIMGDKRYRSWLSEILPQTLAVRDRIKEVFGCNIFSLNPFVGLNLEGHVVS